MPEYWITAEPPIDGVHSDAWFAWSHGETHDAVLALSRQHPGSLITVDLFRDDEQYERRYYLAGRSYAVSRPEWTPPPFDPACLGEEARS